jgi:TP901 family phage tail tape measure protein
MTQFSLNGSQLPHVADLLAAGAGKAMGSVEDMGQALNQAGLLASSTGISIEETTGALAAFASAGLIGSDAGTSFKTMLQQLQNPSKESAELMAELGINAYDAQGNFVGLPAWPGSCRRSWAG